MKETIVDILDEIKMPLNEMDIYKVIKKEQEVDLTELCDAIREMEKKGELYRTNKGDFTLFKYTHFKTGRLSVHKKGFGFVIIENGPDIHILDKNMNGAIHSDFVAVEMISKEEGRIVKVIDRSLNQIVGEFVTEKNKNYIQIDNEKVKILIEIKEQDRNEAMPGHKVLVEPYKKVSNEKYFGKVTKVLGHKDDPGVDILSVVYENEINDIFSQEVIDETESIPLEIDQNEIKNREDLRNEKIFTIDGETAKDFDDAISIKKLDNNNYLLGVHIADVTHYVREGSALNDEALDRATSVYLVDRVIPMLPHKLSNGICSLNPNVDRFTFSCDIEIDPSGNIVNSKIYESVINSKKRMTYTDVNKVFNNEEVKGYEDFKEDLFVMKNLASTLRKNKIGRGYIDFDIDEIEVIVDDEGKPIDVKKRERGNAEKMIEDFMIAANESVAEYVSWLDYPFIYRVHEKPKLEKIRNYLELLNNLGHKIKGNPNKISPKFMQNILERIKGSEDFAILSELGLRSMQKADYRVDNLGHFGLASKFYSHFTSPIRRYPDLAIHRLLKDYVKGQNLEVDKLKEIKERLVYVSQHSSLKERKAIECERQVVDMKTAEYMEDKIGKEYQGVISGVISSGMFVKLDNLIEGFIHVSTLDGDFYIFDEVMHSFIGRNSKKIYRIGNRLDVRVVSASKKDKTIDFELVKTKK